MNSHAFAACISEWGIERLFNLFEGCPSVARVASRTRKLMILNNTCTLQSFTKWTFTLKYNILTKFLCTVQNLDASHIGHA